MVELYRPRSMKSVENKVPKSTKTREHRRHTVDVATSQKEDVSRNDFVVGKMDEIPNEDVLPFQLAIPANEN